MAVGIQYCRIHFRTNLCSHCMCHMQTTSRGSSNWH